MDLSNQSDPHETPRRRLTPAQRLLLENLQDGGILRRRGEHSTVRDLNFWLGGNRAYTQENRSSADGLVTHGLAEWYEYTKEESYELLATHELRLTEKGQKRDQRAPL